MNIIMNKNVALLHPLKLSRGISNVRPTSVFCFPLSTNVIRLSAKCCCGKEQSVTESPYSVNIARISNRSIRKWSHSAHLYSSHEKVLQDSGYPSLFRATCVLNNKHIGSSCRYYSQNNSKSNTFLSTKKWSLILLSTGLVGVFMYKVFYDNEVTHEIPNKNGPQDQTSVSAQLVQRDPAISDDIPANVPYLLIGGGTAAFSAFRAIKALDSTAKVLIVTNEPYYPYMRPPLTKELLYNEDRTAARKLSFTQWDGSERSVFFEPEEFYLPCKELSESETGGVCVARSWNVIELNPDLKYVVLDDGKRISYNKCLLATGAVPTNLPIFLNSDPSIQKKVTPYRTLNDFIELEDAIENGAKSIAIIGGGFTGSELACSLARRGLKVVQIYKEGSNMAQVLPEYLSKWLTAKMEKQGVNTLRNSEIEGVTLVGNKLSLSTTNGIVLADHVIIATSLAPNTDLAKSASLEIDNTLGGFMVNSELEARRDLFAAGDCASFYDPQFGRRRVERHDHAVISGRLAGENMTGARKPFVHQSMFWSDLGPELGYEAIGIVDSSLPTVAIYLQDNSNNIETDKEDNLEKSSGFVYSEQPDDFKKGVVFYLKNEKVVGVVLWNIFNRISIARQVLKSNIGLEDLREVAKLFNISKTAAE